MSKRSQGGDDAMRRRVIGAWFGGIALFVVFLLVLEPIAAAINSWWFMLLLGMAIGWGGPRAVRLAVRKAREARAGER